MKLGLKYSIPIFFMIPLMAIGQNDHSNPPVQQQVNLYGGTSLDNNPNAIDNNVGNSEFVIHEVIQQSNKTQNEVFDQQMSNSSNNIKQSFISAGGGSIGSGLKRSVALRRSKQKLHNKLHKWFYRSPQKKHSSASCFSWT